MDEMLNCSMGANPLEHLKVPTLLYVRAAKFDIWNAKQPEGKLVTQNSDIMGHKTTHFPLNDFHFERNQSNIQ